MNRRSFLSKIGLPLMAIPAVAQTVDNISVRLVEKSGNFVAMVTPICPHCSMQLALPFLAGGFHHPVKSGVWFEVDHPELKNWECPYSGKRFRLKLPEFETEAL